MERERGDSISCYVSRAGHILWQIGYIPGWIVCILKPAEFIFGRFWRRFIVPIIKSRDYCNIFITGRLELGGGQAIQGKSLRGIRLVGYTVSRTAFGRIGSRLPGIVPFAGERECGPPLTRDEIIVLPEGLGNHFKFIKELRLTVEPDMLVQ
ncbi:hypothetical protein [Methanoculleus sp.]|uniref:hypothetical protein n=1 Tax=Methanoculleus sp. TaxID=90427 RepID=UPI0025CB9D3D|nr:hypothetical protein [Methanoculleus sp.]